MDTEKRLADLRNILKLQCAHGNWDYDPYMHGIANGLILAEHIMDGRQDECEFLEAPRVWGKNYPTIWTRIKWFFFPPKPVATLGGNVKL